MKYTKEFLINEIKRFVGEFKRLPISSDFEFKRVQGYPSRKTFSNHFGSFENAITESGYGLKQQLSKEEVLKIVANMSNELSRTPSLEELDNVFGCDARNQIRKFFKDYNELLIELNLNSNNKRYTDEELRNAFFRFIEENGRTPIIKDFLNTNGEYPSFDTYQDRYGSWNNAFKAFGFEVNDGNRHYEFEDGEICKSSYEYSASKYLRECGIRYKRNVKYKDFIKQYSGRKDCDYVVEIGNVTFLIEIAGFKKYQNNSKNKSSVEIDYLRRYEEKVDMIYDFLENNDTGKTYEFYEITGDEFSLDTIENIMEFLTIRK